MVSERVEQQEALKPSDKLNVSLYRNGNDFDEQGIAALKQVRAEYVRAMNWFPDQPDRDDTDIYDSDPTTLHLATRENNAEQSEVSTSMRLTRVDSLEGSLSWSMIELNPEMVKQASAVEIGGEPLTTKLNKCAANGNLWDLTRLVHPLEDRADKEVLLAGLMEMIGAGIDKTAEDFDGKDDELAWVFTITPTVKLALDFLGIQNIMMAEGKISAHDSKKSYFCVAFPMSALKYARDNAADLEFTVKHVENGLRKANAL